MPVETCENKYAIMSVIKKKNKKTFTYFIVYLIIERKRKIKILANITFCTNISHVKRTNYYEILKNIIYGYI